MTNTKLKEKGFKETFLSYFTNSKYKISNANFMTRDSPPIVSNPARERGL
jgi:hypothetical protein